ATYARNEVLPLCELIQDAINSAGLPRSLWVDFRENIGSTV
ncbi:MAG: phage portal protein, partial [Aeromonas veronii]